MKQIVFEHESLNVEISSKEIGTHIWRGFNFSSDPVIVNSMKVSCGCLSFDPIKILPANSEFEFKTYINKLNQSGLFSVSLFLEFSNDEKQTLKLSGKYLH